VETDQTALTDMYKSTRWFNAEPWLAVMTVIQLIDELELHRNLQNRPISPLVISSLNRKQPMQKQIKSTDRANYRYRQFTCRLIFIR